MRPLSNSDKLALFSLLENAALPISDIEFNEKKLFFGEFKHEKLIGAVGLEIFKNTSLLRSLVVDKSARKKGLGKKLVTLIEKYLNENNIKTVYLLTTTAEKFFENLGYKKMTRSEAPEDIKNTSQFSDLCPNSSIFMGKYL